MKELTGFPTFKELETLINIEIAAS